MTEGYAPYAPRATGFHGVIERAGHRLKAYSVRYGDPPFDRAAYGEGLEMALGSLPEADPDAGRPGLGFVIVHRGRGMDYVVLAWWDRENELPVRVFVREGDGAWRPAGGSESFCVWDLEIVAAERDAYVATVLAGAGGGGPEAYLERVATGG